MATASVIRDKCKENVKYVFSEAELKDKARALSEKDQAESEYKSVKKMFDARIAAADSQAKLCSEHYRNGYEYRYVECEKVTDYGMNELSVVRLDTGEVVFSRSLTEDEKQMRLV